MIDLRSDTVTRPSEGMRRAMYEAEVGDDVFGEDPTVNRLQETVAELLGKEAALFVPTGMMGNQVALKAHTQPGDEVIVERTCHIFNYESGAPGVLSGVVLHVLQGERGLLTAEQVRGAVRHGYYWEAPSRLLCLENTLNKAGGIVYPLARTLELAAVAREHGLRLHLDGARLWNATAATGIAERDYAAPFDTVNVCFSKGLGAPVGSALAGSEESVARARRFKQQLGGGMRQAGVLAAAALYALDHHRPRLGDDVQNARTLADGLAAIEGIAIDPADVHSNIVRFDVTVGSAADFAERCHAAGVYMIPGGARGVRAVVHRDVGAADVARAVEIIASVLPRRASA
jgi:threonine aldolase